ncbi:BREX system Lon protease-like protein BrxL [Nostoc sp. 106C]|uniref:BREX system Lon protease-like protein BrxL n=1 Tax=Nostoc sp. 106C TaxID=1932667 RepID=UPI000A36026F|nr:BREX system Lon protease-like protein BrxL [Nostoc sp. 106C]OUL32343.1 TIGR02688 family protein [Nostoc sp. 106C]
MNSCEALAYNNNLVRHVFGNLCIDKTRLPSSGLSTIGIPSFVAEWLLDKIVPGEGTLTFTELEKVNSFIKKAFPRKDDRNEIIFNLTQGEVQKLIALMLVRVRLEEQTKSKPKLIPEPSAQIPALNLTECKIAAQVVERYKMLLRQGIWGKISLSMLSDGKVEVIGFEPFQCSQVDLQAYADCRDEFNTQQWRDLIFCSMGFNPEHPSYDQQAKTWILARLLPLVESNFHIMELAPKGTGKSFVFENISSKIALVSGGKVTPAQLFINGRTKEVGLLGRHDVVVLDEVQSLTFDNPDEVIGPLKNYLASGRYNRSGFADIASDCSLVMLANIELLEINGQLQPRNEDNLIINLPNFFAETALLDRFTGIIPGWEIPKFKREMVASQVGLKMDFFGEALLSLRQEGRFMSYAQQHTQFDKNTTIRDQNAILKAASGFLKILYPHLKLTLMDYQRDCLEPALKLRQAIRNSLYHLDDEFKQFGREIYVEVK